MDNYLRDVRIQYEHYPYPERDPAEELKRLNITGLDRLPVVNHFCFNGSKDFRTGFRVLVAGGGTGDAAIYLAEQLRDTQAEIVYLDMSTASLEIARERAAVRNLTNIHWINDSILNIPSLHLGQFDYINCSGVLHHLKSPSAGLEILNDALDDDGAMGIMVYAKYGRTGIYQMQELMRLLNQDEFDDKTKVMNAKAVLAELPDSNWFSMGKHLTSDHTRYGDIGIYDLFLHSQDRAYSIPELYEWLDAQHLKLITFPVDMARYLPESYIRDPILLKRIKGFPVTTQQSIAELLCGNIMKHAFYCRKNQGAEPSIESDDFVPFLWGSGNNHMAFHDMLYGLTDSEALVLKAGPVELKIQRSDLALSIFKHMNGEQTVTEIANKINKTLPYFDMAVIIGGIRQLYEILHFAGIGYLRHKMIPMYPDDSQLQKRTFRHIDKSNTQ